MGDIGASMLVFRNALLAYLPKIKKTANLTEARLLPGKGGVFTHTFTFVGSWSYPTVGELRREFTRENVFGSHLHDMNPVPHRRPCDVKSEIIRDITSSRLRR